MSTHDSREAAIERLRELIKDIKFAMLATVEPDGSLRSRPMVTQQMGFDGDLWFMTDRTTAKCHEVERERHVNVSFAEPSRQRYVSVSGRARQVDDRERIRQLWNPMYKAWFPRGVDDPNITLIKVHVDHAEYWDSPSSKVVQLVGFARAALTGERADNVGEHEKLTMDVNVVPPET